MRLVRLERQQSRVADDVRAALASLGRGSTVIGGIALVGVGSVTERPIEAVVLLPHGVIIVIGVDLPDPALRLEAPLGAEWKADGWPLVADDDAINPATEALDISQACEQRIASLVPGTAPVGTIIAVGPYVETVDQPAGDLAGPVRVLHPTPTTMLAATVSLATAHRPRSVDQVRALIRGLAPEAPELSDEVLLGEGFSRFTDDAPPESLWDAVPPVPAQVRISKTEPPMAATSAVPPVAEGPKTGSAAASPPATAAADWRTETPVPAEQAAEARPVESDVEPDLSTAAETDAEPAAAVAHAGPTAAETEPEPVDETPSPLEESEPTEVLEAEPVRVGNVLPLFPGTEPPRSTQPSDPEPAAADTKRTENLRLPTAPPLTQPPPAEPEPEPAPAPREPAKPRASRTVRWLPLGAIALLVALAVAAVAVATSSDDTAATPTPPPPTTAQPTTTTAAPAQSLQFALRAADADQRCASHAFGDAQASLQQTSCSGVRRASYAATIDGRPGAVTVGIVAFPDAAQAAAFKAVADTPGGGGILDLATETGKWGATTPPRFENAAYASKLDGTSVRLVQAVWAPGPSTPDDPGLARAAKAALDLPAQ
ncbi:hypothetical protein [Amycolatopsis nalaikhensis]|uniref:Uncharacterized protein n=1 Tax=Amycolatopsis nalaikhensis TaxID=715472 RepID=A0ABY8XNH0_9PSEU|nr:hypothetical protein [Amycolatopsis sp. 2-2]WIV57164.1 hypothetical protein QP939_00205 [Amycolatopsis sp. 2-2]